ncbi:MAG: prolyl oligopeptidase family serine peptidase, partial [Acidimicrobiia bacterium]|nr:prolyl oligopeptidase family serine peptidase [Acidimicrobiia bacterium]
MKPTDLAKLNIPSDPRISPHGEAVLFTVSRPNLDDDRYDQTIWIADANGARPFTEGVRDTNPRWSPDATRVAFTRREDDEAKPQVAIISTDGDEVRIVTDFDRGVEALEWSPDGKRIAVVAVTYVEEWAGLDDDERKRKPRRIKSVPYRFDNRGWIHNKRRHIWLVDPDGSEDPRCLTPGDYDDELLSWSPDGKRIAFISDRDPARGLRSGNDVFEVSVETGETIQVAPRGFWVQTSYSPSGHLHVLGNTNPVYPVNSLLYRVEEDGTLTDLTGKLDRNSVSLSAGPPRVAWDGDDAIVGQEDSGSFGLVRVSPSGLIDEVVTGEQVVTGYDAEEGRVVATYSTPTSPGELYSFEDRTRQLTHLDTGDVSMVGPDHFTTGSAGHEIDVWVYLPEGEEAVPLLLNIHGGPASQYGYGFFDEFQVYVGAGYGVVACNPRGSTGKGESFTKAVTGEGWGAVDLEDV